MTVLIDRRTWLSGAGSLALAPTAIAATQANYPALTAFLQSFVDPKKLPGAVLAIKNRSDPVRYISRGTLAFDTDAPAGPQSLFRIYSMTKPITGLAVMKLIETGKLRLDQPVAEVIPEFSNLKVIVDPATLQTTPVKTTMTIRHLLTHTSGLSYNIGRGPLAALYTKNGVTPGGREKSQRPGEDRAPITSLEDMVQRLSLLPLDFEPGTKWEYSVAFDVLGLVIKRVSGMGFYDYLQSQFFQPLKMTDTDFVVPAAKLDRLTSVVALKDGVLKTVDDRRSSPFALDRDLPSGGGGLVSTAHDYIRFTTMLLNEGQLDGVRVVEAQTVRTARSNLLPSGVSFYGANGFGAGVMVVSAAGAKPGGEPAGSYSWFGIAGTQMWVDPVNQFSVVLMLQMNPTTYPVQAEVRAAAYNDLSALRA